MDKITASVGLFETDSDVRLYARRVDSQVQGLDKDLMNYILKTWGPNGLSATVADAAALQKKRDDKAFYDAWAAFRDSWNGTKADIDDSYFIALSANKYREVEKYDVDSQAWRQKFLDRKIAVSAPALTQGGGIPGITPPTNPDAPGRNSLLGDVLTGAAKIVAIAGVGYFGLKFLTERMAEKRTAKDLEVAMTARQAKE